MTQEIVKQKLIRFLEYQRENNDIDSEYNAKLQVLLDRGHCVSLSICYGAQHAVGSRDWWKEILSLAANWNEDANLLDLPLTIKHAKSATPTTLRAIFTEILNNTIFHSPKTLNYALPKYDISETRCLTSKQHFEILSHDNKVHTIQSYDYVAGSIPKIVIAEILSQLPLTGTICIIGNTVHAICVTRETRQSHNLSDSFIETSNEEMNCCYKLYSANRSHLDPLTIDREYSSVDKLVKAINKKLRGAIYIHLAHLTTTSLRLKHYKTLCASLTTEKALELIKGRGLLVLTRHAPKLLVRVVSHIPNDVRYAQDILDSLVKKDSHENTAFQLMACYNPHTLKKLLDIVYQLPHAANTLARAIAIKNENNTPAFLTIIKYRPSLLPALLTVIAASTKFTKNILASFVDANAIRHSTLDSIIKHCPNILSDLTVMLIRDGQVCSIPLIQSFLDKHGIEIGLVMNCLMMHEHLNVRYTAQLIHLIIHNANSPTEVETVVRNVQASSELFSCLLFDKVPYARYRLFSTRHATERDQALSSWSKIEYAAKSRLEVLRQKQDASRLEVSMATNTDTIQSLSLLSETTKPPSVKT